MSHPNGYRQPIDQERGLTLIEVLMALVILLFVVFTMYRVFIGGSEASSAAHARLTALKFAEMEIEQIAETAFNDLPPEKHELQTVIAKDDRIASRVRLSRQPIKGTVRVWMANGEPMDDEFTVDYPTGSVVLPAELSGKAVIVSYAYEYPRREMVVIPKRPPYRVRLSAFPVRNVIRAIDGSGHALPVSIDNESGFLTAQSQYAGKSVMVEYRGVDDQGRAGGKYLSEDLKSDSPTDTGIKLITLTETWRFDGRKKELELSYVHTRQ